MLRVSEANAPPEGTTEATPMKCVYCECCNPAELVRCAATGQYFCNGSSQGVKSHAVFHLIKSKNTAIELPEANPHHRTPLRCVFCGSTNIFMLGVASTVDGDVPVYVCRNKCLSEHRAEIKQNTWCPLLQDNRLSPELVPPTLKGAYQAYSTGVIHAYEDAMTKNERKLIEVVEREYNALHEERNLARVKEEYSTVEEYVDVYGNLATANFNWEVRDARNCEIKNVDVNWECSHSATSKSLVHFKLPVESRTKRFKHGSYITIKDNSGQYTGYINKVKYVSKQGGTPEHFLISARSNRDVNDRTETRCTIKLPANVVAHKRMIDALERLNERAQTLGPIASVLLGKSLPGQHTLNVKPIELDLDGLNDSQREACREAYMRPFSIIQGPPGTGKTHTIARMCMMFHNSGVKQILAAAPSNAATDNMAEKIAGLGLTVLRVISLTRLEIEPDTLYTLQWHLEDPMGLLYDEYMELQALADRSLEGDKQLKKFVRDAEKRLVRECDVTCCTCSGAASAVLQKTHYPVVIVDEATQAVEPEVLIPVIRSTGRVVLVGDHKQLGPVVKSMGAKAAHYDRSMIERLVLREAPTMLNVQYRMHPAISGFSSARFYDGRLEDGVRAEDRPSIMPSLCRYARNFPLLFFDASIGEEVCSTDGSYSNAHEAELALKYLHKLHGEGVSFEDIVVIVPYTAQQFVLRDLVANEFTAHDAKELKISTVDSFQGSESEYVIMCTVRHNAFGSLGFLKDPRRLNVSITRAKRGLIVIGAAATLLSSPLWASYLRYFKEHNAILCGDVSSPKLSSVFVPHDDATLSLPLPTPYSEQVTAMLTRLAGLVLGALDALGFHGSFDPSDVIGHLHQLDGNAHRRFIFHDGSASAASLAQADASNHRVLEQLSTKLIEQLRSSPQVEA